MQHCIGGLANVLSDYEKTGQSEIHSNCYHLTDKLSTFGQNSITPALFKRPDVRCLAMFTKYPRIHAPT